MSLLSGYAIPVDGLTYGAGAGLSLGVSRSLFFGGITALLHQGNSVTINYGGVGGLGISGGDQHYQTLPVFLLADAGVSIEVAPKLSFAAFGSIGTVLLNPGTSGVYGAGEIVNSGDDPVFALGWGVSARAWLLDHWGLGIQYRMLPLGDGDFSYGDTATSSISHGYSTSLFYNSLLAEVTYRF